jgi:ketosteroid isomerase-like protein
MPQTRTPHPLSFAVAPALLSAALLLAGILPSAGLSQAWADIAPPTALDRVNAQLNSNPKDLQAMFIRAVMLAEQNKRDEAIKAFTEITEKYPNLPEPFNNLAVLYADQGQYDKAKKALEAAIKTHPSYATAHENLGDIYAKMASEAYDKALQLDTNNTRAQGKLSLIREVFIANNKASTAVASKPATPKPSDVAALTPPPASITPPTPVMSAPIAKPEPQPKPSDVAKTEPLKTPDPIKAEPVKNNPDPVRNDDTSANSRNDASNIKASVEKWVSAWSSRNAEAYLDSYADSFQPPKGYSRKEWEQERKQRINKPVKITVEVSNLHISKDGNNRAQASFKQSYRAGSLSQRTNKTLILVRNNGKWLIEQERTDR